MVAIAESSNEVVWLAMRLLVPGGWEIARHSVREQKGRLVWIDRRHQRLLLNWADAPTPPDAAHLFRDYEALEEQRNPGCEIVSLPGKCGWSGFRRSVEGDVLTRAGRYERELKRWIEITICWPEGFDARLESAILREFQAGAGYARRVKAFGIDIHAPEGWGLVGAAVKPGSLELDFRSRRSSATIRRLGMAGTWFDGDIAGFLQKELEPGGRASEEMTFQGRPARLEQSREKVSRFDALLGRRRVRRDLAWFCDATDAVMQVTTWSPRRLMAQPQQWLVLADGRRDSQPGRDDGDAAGYAGEGRLDGGELLGATPSPNSVVTTGRSRAGELVLHVPIRQRWYMKPPVSWIFPFSRVRSIALDRVGESVWAACDGHRTVEEIVEWFAARHRLSFHEARLGVMEFLRRLTQRGYILMAVPAREEGEP